MRKTIYKILTILFCIVLLMSLAGCTENKVNEEKKNTEIISVDEEKENLEIQENEPVKTFGKMTEMIKPENYGDKIRYYANNIEDWRIFYNDGENVFIIAERNIPNTYIPTDIGLINQSQYMGSFEVHWDDDTFAYSGISAIKSSVIDKYMFKWAKENPNSEIETAKSAASLMDTDKWSIYVDTMVADSAIGTPTLDMFIASWNQVEDRKIYFDKTNEYGYFVGKTANAEDYDVSMYNKPEIEEGKGNEFYLVNKELSYGYWLIGPSAKGEEWMLAVDKYGLDVADSWVGGNGLRPVVCLNADINGEFLDDVWVLEK